MGMGGGKGKGGWDPMLGVWGPGGLMPDERGLGLARQEAMGSQDVSEREGVAPICLSVEGWKQGLSSGWGWWPVSLIDGLHLT